MNNTQKQAGWGFGLLWLLATFVGMQIGFFSGFVAANLIHLVAKEPFFIPLVLGAGIGTGIGTLQWLLLRTRVRGAGRWWIPASAMVGCASFYALSESANGWMDVATVTAYGTATGLLQWLALRKQVSRAGWWIPACAICWGLGVLLMVAFGMDKEPASPLSYVLLGAITGGVMVWLLRNQKNRRSGKQVSANENI